MKKVSDEEKLSDIALVKTGLVLSRKVAEDKTNATHEYKQLNLKSINEDGSINRNELECFDSTEELSDNYLTQTDDIVVRLTYPHTAVLINEEYQNIVISSHFCLIRINSKTIIPEYLYWYLNSDFVKSQVIKNISSAAFIAVKPGFYSNLLLNIPSIIQQKLIGEYFSMAQKEIRLLESLVVQKTTFNKLILKKLYQQVIESE